MYLWSFYAIPMKDLTKGSELRVILSFAFPMLIGSLFQQFYNIVDRVIVGNFVGHEALAAVGSSFPLIFVLISMVIGISNGINIVISQYFGAKDFIKVKLAIDTMYIFVFFSSILMTVIGLLLSKYVFEWIKTPDEVIPQATLYFNIFVSGFILMFGFHATSAILRGLGDSKTPLYFLIVSTVVNIFLDWLFIGPFGWGVAGAAYATIISQGVALVLAIIYLKKVGSIIKFKFWNFQFDKAIFVSSIKIGIPSGMQTTFVALGGIVLFRIVNDFGTETIAAYSAAMGIDALASQPAMVFAAALSVFVGQNIGANKLYRVKKGLRHTWIMSTIVSLVVTTVVVIFSAPIMRLFSDNADVIRIGQNYLTIVCAFYVIFSSMFVTNGVMRGAGATIIPMFVTLISIWILRLPLSWIFSHGFDIFGWHFPAMGPNGIWWGIPIAWTFGAIASFIYYLSGRWKRFAVVKHVEEVPKKPNYN